MRSQSSLLTTILITATVTALFTYIVSRGGTTNSRDVTPSAFYLGVSVIFPTPQDREKFKALFSPLAIYVKENEPGTLSYELLESDKDESRILILERYKNKDYYLNVHRSSKEFLSFRGEFQKMIDGGAKVDGHSYLETGVGYV